ncbi:hypothetical protein SUGI_0440600 [Cryptomeria japonica]|nr:hypothetical protein SUGI_0440600 [Cryptomeria japonica]
MKSSAGDPGGGSSRPDKVPVPSTCPPSTDPTVDEVMEETNGNECEKVGKTTGGSSNDPKPRSFADAVSQSAGCNPQARFDAVNPRPNEEIAGYGHRRKDCPIIKKNPLNKQKVVNEASAPKPSQPQNGVSSSVSATPTNPKDVVENPNLPNPPAMPRVSSKVASEKINSDDSTIIGQLISHDSSAAFDPISGDGFVVVHSKKKRKGMHLSQQDKTPQARVSPSKPSSPPVLNSISLNHDKSRGNVDSSSSSRAGYDCVRPAHNGVGKIRSQKVFKEIEDDCVLEVIPTEGLQQCLPSFSVFENDPAEGLQQLGHCKEVDAFAISAKVSQ